LYVLYKMSAANSAAKKRRAPPSTEPIRPAMSNMQGQPQQQSNGNPSSGLTLPQVIALIDNRLVRLETTTKTLAESSNVESETSVSAISPEVLEEFNTRFEIIAEEVANIKNIVLNLQSYTMNVNKMLLDERKMNGNSTDQFVMGGVSLTNVEVDVDIEDENEVELEETVDEDIVVEDATPQWTKQQ
jgi:hypothetical protein